MASKLLYLKTEWMEFYDGRKGDKPAGTHGYVQKYKEAHEDRNFKVVGKHVYGYASSAGGGGGINIDRLGAKSGDESITDIDVVFLAAKPGAQGVRVVGWYQNATVYRSLQTRGSRNYLVKCKAGQQTRLSVDDRGLVVKRPPRRSAVWYGREDVDDAVRKLIRGIWTPSKRGTVDREKCLEIESKAYSAVIEKYERAGYDIYPVHKENKGWDIEAVRGKERLQIEVKGLSGSAVAAELTPNEYSKSKKQKSYRICIVTDVLSKNATVHTFKKNYANKWYDETGAVLLLFHERVAARVVAN